MSVPVPNESRLYLQKGYQKNLKDDELVKSDKDGHCDLGPDPGEAISYFVTCLKY